jgi:excisionase family DNA binding protein
LEKMLNSLNPTQNQDIKKGHRIINPLPKRLYRLREAAIYLGRPCSSLRSLIHSGKLPVVREGKTFYLDIKDLDAFIEYHKITFDG